MDKDHPDYIKDWVKFNGEEWDYGAYKKNCYVCFIHKIENRGDS